MRLTVDDIKRQTKSETKLIKARKVQQENLIKKIYIAKTQSEYHVEARMETLSGKFYATLQFTLNAESDVDYYFCSCKRTKICEHLLAVLYQIHDLQPEKFPYSYERKEEEIAVQRLHNFRCFSRVHHLLRKRSRGFLQKRKQYL